MSHPPPGDPTPVSGGWTDVAPLGNTGPKPPHEQTADEERGLVDWDGIAIDPGFRALVASKARFVVPAMLFFLVYYFALPVLVGWFPDLMKTRVGPVNVAYLFALSQFFMAWAIAALYVAKAAGWDKKAAEWRASITKR